jgi:arsenical pump membrane protein
MFTAIATLAIFVATLMLIMLRPYGITESAAAIIGAVLMLLFRSIDFNDMILVTSRQWNVYGFFLGLMTISALADRAGVFEWLAYRAGRWAGGSAMRLYLAVFAIGTLITTFQSNDATALILTPIVFALVTRLNLAVLPFMFACTFIADTASFMLPVSNPINILILDAFGSDLATFLRYMLLPSVFCVLANTAAFAWLFRHDLRQRYNMGELQPVRPPNERFFRFTLMVLGLVGIAYIVASALHIPLSLVALSGAGLLLSGAAYYHCLEWPTLRREISWSLFVFITGMFLVVRGVEKIGLTAMFGNGMLALAGTSPLQAALVAAGGTALGANLINNVPMTLVMISALRGMQAAPLIRETMVYATMFGADLGPNLTTVGSLATILWIVILRRKGLEISPRSYVRLGVLVVPLMIAVGSFFIAMRP